MTFDILDSTVDTKCITQSGGMPYTLEHSLTYNTDRYVIGNRYVATIRHLKGSRRWEVEAPTLRSSPLILRTGKAARAYAESVVDALS